MKHLTDQLLSEKKETELQVVQLRLSSLERILFQCLELLRENNDRVSTDKQLAERYGVHQDTVREWRKKGLPSRKEGKTVFILESDFIEWVAQDKL
jgi:DNA-binding transcriptional regulator YiaG